MAVRVSPPGDVQLTSRLNLRLYCTAVNTSAPEIPRINRSWFWLVFTAVLLLCAAMEWQRFQSARIAGMEVLAYITFWNMESTLPLLLLICLAALWMFSRQRSRPAGLPVPPATSLVKTVVCVALFLVSIAASRFIGDREITFRHAGETVTVAFADLPSTYHDEFSYQLQAQTFLDGRLSYPPAQIRPDLFHQMHVLNERRTMSRYFPATGIWIAPFLYFDAAIAGHWIAGALAVVFFYLTLLRIVSPRTAAVASALIAVSPGIAVFSNLLLAHHPTLLALSIFTYSFVRMDESVRLRWAFAAGLALTFAMLGRPMTAAGFGLPFGLRLLRRMFTEADTRKLALGFAVPISLGFALLGLMNYEATGHVTRSAYQIYTDQFTPRHKYGFNNAVDTPEPAGPPAIKAYDDWATNLTPQQATLNVWKRLRASFRWSLGTMPLLFGSLLVLPTLFCASPKPDSSPINRPDYLRLLAWAILSLHLVHVPYWFDGILHWHYVFETAPLLLILATAGFATAKPLLDHRIGRLGALWISVFMLSSLVPAWFRMPVFDNESKVSAAISEQSFSRIRFAHFQLLTTSDMITKPALVMVDEEGSDPQLSYIINPGDYDSDVLVCRLPTSDAYVHELSNHYEDRTLYVFSPREFTLTRWRPRPAARE